MMMPADELMTDRLMAGAHIRIFFYLPDANYESRWKTNKKQQCNTKKAKSKLNSTKTRTFKKRLLYNSELTNFDFSTYYLVGAEVV